MAKKTKAKDPGIIPEPNSPAERKKKINAAMDAMIDNLIAAATNTKKAGSVACIDAYKQLKDIAGADQGEEYKIDLMFVPIQRLDDGKYSVIPLKTDEPKKDESQSQNQQQA